MIRNQLANIISALRLAASPFLAWLLLRDHYRASLFLIAFAGATDWLDGLAARHLGAGGKLGVVLDPLADKVMLLVLFVILTVIGKVPLFLLILVIARDLVIVTGALLLRILRNIRTFLPTMLGKISTFFQIAYVITIVLNAAFPNRLFWFLQEVGMVSTIFFTFSSGVGYVQKGIRLAGETTAVRSA